MWSMGAGVADASCEELARACEAIAAELAARPAPESGTAALETAELVGGAADLLEAALATLVERVDATGAHGEHGFPSVVSWLRERLGMRHGRAAERATVARQLPRLHRLRKLLTGGGLSFGYASAVCAATPRLDAEDAAVAEDILVGMVEDGCTVGQVAKAGERITDLVAERLGRQTEPADSRRGFARSWMTRSRSLEGGSWFKGWCNPEHTAAFDEIIGPLAKPRARGDDRDIAQRTADALFSVLTEGNRGAGVTLIIDLAAYIAATGDTGPFTHAPRPTPDSPAPDFAAPDFTAPDFEAPDFAAPDSTARGFRAPDFTAPDSDAPGFASSGSSVSDSPASGFVAQGSAASEPCGAAADAVPAAAPGVAASDFAASGSPASGFVAQGSAASEPCGAAAAADAVPAAVPGGNVESGEQPSRAGPPKGGRQQVAARLLDGTPISPEDARRIALNAGISAVVLGRRGIPIYLGRSTRFATAAQRKVLLARFDTCCVLGCRIPAHLCEIHHLNGGWKLGTPTDIDQLAPLCGWHNRWIETHDGQVVETTDSQGRAVLKILPPRTARRSTKSAQRRTDGDHRRQPGAP